MLRRGASSIFTILTIISIISRRIRVIRIIIRMFEDRYNLRIWVLGFVGSSIGIFIFFIIINGTIIDCSFLFSHIESFDLNLTK